VFRTLFAIADPVHPATGVTTVSETDFVSGGDLPLVFKRTYRDRTGGLSLNTLVK
jgi:hypothetical protein